VTAGTGLPRGDLKLKNRPNRARLERPAYLIRFTPMDRPLPAIET
jgi:hypothetical protein